MDELSKKEYLEKSGQILEKYRNNLHQLRNQIHIIESRFFMPDEMVDYFYANKSEFNAWQAIQDMIITLEDAYAELVASMMEAISDPDAYNFYLQDKRITVMELKEEEEDSEGISLDDELQEVIDEADDKL